MSDKPAIVNKAYAELEEHWDVNISDLHEHQHTELSHQIAFLDAYDSIGTMSGAAQATGLSRQTAYKWRASNHFRFKERLEAAHSTFCDMLEDKARELAMGLQPGQNSLILVTLLNANRPDKYRPNAVIPSEAMTDVLRAMKQSTREFRRMEDGTEVVTETVTETTELVKKGLSVPRTEE